MATRIAAIRCRGAAVANDYTQGFAGFLYVLLAFSVVVPLPDLVGFTMVDIVAGTGAAIILTRRASRLNVLDALHYE